MLQKFDCDGSPEILMDLLPRVTCTLACYEKGGRPVSTVVCSRLIYFSSVSVPERSRGIVKTGIVLLAVPLVGSAGE